MLYPVTIIPDRYTGTYSGAQWLAFNQEPREVDNSGAEDSDIECFDFWQSPEAEKVGRGDTPDKALKDLVKRGGL